MENFAHKEKTVLVWSCIIHTGNTITCVVDLPVNRCCNHFNIVRKAQLSEVCEYLRGMVEREQNIDNFWEDECVFCSYNCKLNPYYCEDEI
jgi:endonuclease III